MIPRQAALKIHGVGRADRAVGRQLDGRALNERTGGHDDLRVVARHRPRDGVNVAVHGRGRLNALAEGDHVLCRAELDALDDVVARLRRVRDAAEAEPLVDVRREHRALERTGRHGRREEEALIKRRHEPEVRADLLPETGGAQTEGAAVDHILAAADVAADGREAAAGVFDERADDHVRAEVGRLDRLDELAVAVVDHADDVRVDALAERDHKTQVKSNDRFSKFRMESPLGKFFTILLYVVMTIIVLIVLLPVLHIIAASFSDPQAMISGKVSFWPKDFTLRGYEAVFTYKKFWTGFRNSLFYMVFGTFINIVMTLLCAYPLSRKEFTARNKVAMFFVFTMYFSGGMVPSFMLVNALGLVDTIWAMLIPGAMSTYNMIIARTYMINSIPDELYEAAEIDGCTPFKYLIRIVVPLSKPIIAVLVLYYGVARWNSYQDAILYLQKANYLQPLQIILREILIMNDIDETMMGNADALARQRGLKDLLQYSVIVIASVPVMIIYPFVQKYFVKGVMIGAVKG